jgi:hypothetical protein
VGAKNGFTGLAWWGAGAVALVGVAQLYFVPRGKHQPVVVRPAVPFLEVSDESEPLRTVDIEVIDDELYV